MTFVAQETAKEIDNYTLSDANTTINDIVNNIQTTALSQVTTQIVNGALEAGATVNIVGVAVDAGYSTRYGTSMQPGILYPVNTTFYKVWWAAYVVYDSNTDLTQITLAEPSTTSAMGGTVMSYQIQIPLIVWVLIVVVGAFVLAIVAGEIISWIKSMTTTTSTTTSTITNPTNQPITVQTPEGSYTIPPGGSLNLTNTTTSPNLGGIITVGAVAVGLVGVGIFSYAFLKGLQKPK
jgi:hypothetical protein